MFLAHHDSRTVRTKLSSQINLDEEIRLILISQCDFYQKEKIRLAPGKVNLCVLGDKMYSFIPLLVSV